MSDEIDGPVIGIAMVGLGRGILEQISANLCAILLFLQKVENVRFFILWLGVAPNFVVFFCEFRPAGCLALMRHTARG